VHASNSRKDNPFFFFREGIWKLPFGKAVSVSPEGIYSGKKTECL